MSCHRSRAIYRKGVGAGGSQPVLFASSLAEVLKGESLVLALGGLVERVIGPVLGRDFPHSGGYSYDPGSLFCVWMLGLVKGVSSTRALEEHCRYDDRFRYLCKGCFPDHTTLSRFRKALGPRLDELMLMVARAAMSEGHLKLRQVAADGTKLAAACTQWRHRAEAMDEEQDAQTLVTAQGSFLIGYNLQVAVDIESGFIAGMEVVPGANDLRGLEPLLESMERQSPSLPQALVADKGYDSFVNAHALDVRGIAGYLPKSRNSPAPFTQTEDGVFRCLSGHVPKESLWASKEGKQYRNLLVSRCRQCPHAAECGLPRKAHQRRMKVPSGEFLGDRRSANIRCESLEGQALMRARGPTVELAFARLKQQMGLRRFRLRARSGARLEFGMYVLALNLRLLLRLFWRLFWPNSLRLDSN